MGCPPYWRTCSGLRGICRSSREARCATRGSGGLSVDVAVTGLAARAPYMHTGCAATLRDRLSYAACGGSSHGHTARLNGAQLDDLVAYLASL